MTSARVELAAALALAAALVGLGVAFGSVRKNSDHPRVSTFNDGPRGLHAFWLVLADIGAKPQRLRSAPAATDPVDRTLVLASPSEPVTRRETSQIVEWVRAGGRLVVVGGTGAPLSYEAAVTDAFGLSRHPAERFVGEEMRIRDAALRDGLGRIEWQAAWEVTAATPAGAAGKFEELVTTGEHCRVGRLPFGENGGEVVVIADSKLFDNEALFRGDNAVLAARLVLARGAVAFDEFHNGFSVGGGTGHLMSVLASMLVDTWPGRALLVIAFAGALYLIGAAVRLGAPEPERPPPRRALSEHAEALGRIFETAGARREALAILAAGARRVTGPRAGISATLAPADFVRRLRASQAPHAAELAAAIERADGPGIAKDVEMAAVAANLAAAKRRYLHGG